MSETATENVAERAARKGDDASALAGVPRAMGAVQRAQRLGAKAMASGFRWEIEFQFPH